LAVAAAFFAPELFGDRVAATANMARWRPWLEHATPEQRIAPSHNPDCNLSYYPRRFVLHETWREGSIPFWNPYSFCGTPFLADVQAGVLYPPNWVLLPWSPAEQLGWFLFLHVAWGGIGVLLLARRAGAPIGIAALAGTAFGLNGYFVKHFGQLTFLATAAWLPWVILAGLVLADRPSVGRTMWLALAGALLFLAGQPQIALLGAYATLGVVATSLLVSRSGEGEAAKSPLPVVIAVAGAGAIALLLVSAQLLPTLDLASRSARAVLPYSTVISGAFHPVDVIRFVVPEFFGTPLTGDEWSPLFPRGDGFYMRNQLNSVFAGTPVFLLALWGMTGPRTRRAALPFTVLFIVSVLVAFGSPLARLAYEMFPGFRFSRIDRAGSLVVLAQLVPAALGAADLTRARGAGRRVFGSGGLVLVVAGVWLVARAGTSMPEWLGPEWLGAGPPAALDAESAARLLRRTQVAGLFAAGGAAAFLLPASRLASAIPLALAIVQLFVFAAPYRGDRSPEEFFASTPGIDVLGQAVAGGDAGGTRFVRFGRDLPVRPYALSSVLPPSTNVPYRLRDLQGYNALTERRLGDTLEDVLGDDVFSHGIWAGRRIVAPTRAAALEHPMIDALSVGAAVGVHPIDAAGWTEVPARGFRVWKNEEALPRVRLATGGQGVSEEDMNDIVRRGTFDPRIDVWWVGEGKVEGRVSPDDDVDVLVDTWNELAVRTSTASRAMLVIADSYGPGWRATLDGIPVEVLAVYGVVRGMAIPAGVHEVVFRYRPPGFGVGVALSLAGLLLAGTGIAFSVGRGTL
jgi:hypothetical protein